MIQEVKNTLKLFKKNLKAIIAFELFYKVLTFGIFTPIFYFLFTQSLKLTGFRYISASNLISFLQNPINVILLTTIFFTIVFLTLIDLVALIECFSYSKHNRKITSFEMLKAGIKKGLTIFKVKNIFLVLFVILILPITNIVAITGYITKIPIPDYIFDTIRNNYIYSLTVGLLIAFLVYLVIRWIFVFQSYVLEQTDFKKARLKSAKLIKKRYLKTTIKLILWKVTVTIITASFFVILAIVSVYLIKLLLPVKIAYRVAVWTVIIMAIIWSIVKYYIEVPLTLAYLTNMYFDYNKKNNVILKFVEIKKPKKEHNFIFSVIALIIIFIINCSFMYDISMEQIGYFFLKRPQVTAHRGSSRVAPENSMPAFLQAIEDQADYIELDVRETKDEKIVVIHDATLKRLAGVNKRVENLTYKELLKYDLGSHFSKEYKHLRIQTLDEVIKELRGKAKLHIEVKSTGNERNIEESIVKIIKKNRFIKDCIIASNNYDILVNIKKIEPRIQTVYIASVALNNITKMKAADGFSVEISFLNARVINEIHNAKKEVYAWTINNEENIKKAILLNIDHIITDDPQYVKQILDADYMNSALAQTVKKFFD